MRASAPTVYEAKDLEEQKNPAPLYYLNEIDQENALALENKYQKKLAVLDQDIRNVSGYHLLYRVKYFEYLLALGTNFLYIIFQANTAQEGVPTFVNAFLPNATVPEIIGDIVGYPSAVLDCLTYALNFSAKNAAAVDTLDFIYRPALKDRIKNHFELLHQKPRTAAYYGFSESLLLICNLTAIVTELIYINDGLNKLPEGLKWAITLSILYLGNKYMEKYINPAFYEGIENYWLNDKYPSIFKLLKEKEFATFLQIIIKGFISTAGIKAFPVYYYIAIASAATLGWWFPPVLVSGLIVLLNLGYQYPQIVKEYLDDRLIVDEILHRQIDKNAVDHAVRSILGELYTPNNQKMIDDKIEEIYRVLIDIKKQALKKNHTKEHAIRYHPQAALHTLYRGFVGGFFGSTVISPLLLLLIDSPILIPILSISSCAIIFMEMLRRAEQSRIDSRIFRHHLENKPEESKLEEKKSEEKPPVSKKTNTTAKIISTIISAGNGASTAMSTMGTLSRIPAGNNPLTRSSVALITIDNMIATVAFNYKGTAQTVKNLFSCGKRTNKVADSSTMFRAPTAGEEKKPEEKKRSWFCCGSQRR